MKVPELINATNARKLVQLLNGIVLQLKTNLHQWKELLILWHIMKENAIFTVVKMMITISFVTFGSLMLKVDAFKNFNWVHHPTKQSEDQVIVLIFITAECTSSVVFMNWLKKLTR